MADRRPGPDPASVLRVGPIALGLPGVVEEDAWTGMRWRVRGRTFAHVLALHHAEAAERLGVVDGRPVTVVRLRCVGEERAALVAAGPPYLPGDDGEMMSVVLDGESDWTEVAELVAESWRLLAPARLVRELDGGAPPR